ncbi:MAG: hypothetical protein FJY82_03985 [Candidatus Aminicenantes bacterium]|nr:hypothetical protein [Candidatus Aminicenantes bacterium]
MLARGFAAQDKVLSEGSHNAFFENLAALCGQAFEGKVTVGGPADKAFSEQRLIMHVRKCSLDTLDIPFHVGEDRSRTWVITRTGSGLQLKHDHRHRDGSPDETTMYGGHTTGPGWANAQSFPADAYSQELFVRTGMPQSVGNTWHIYIYPGKTFTYRLTREGREFRVDFDLTKPVPAPPPPWGAEKD